MATHAVSHAARRGGLARWVLTGALSGALAMLVVHQGPAAALHAGAPGAVWPLLFWGALWGAVLAATLARLDGLALLAAASVFGAIVPTLVALTLWAPTKGQPPVTGVVPLALVLGAVLNAAWGLGTALGLALFGRRRP